MSSSRSLPRELWRGVSALGGGVSLVVRTPRLWGWALIPAALALIIGVGLAAVGLWLVASLAHDLFSAGGTLATIGRVLFDVLAGAVVVFIAAVIALALAQPLGRVGLDRLARRMEEATGALSPGQLPSSGVASSLAVAASALGVTLPTIGVLEGVTLFVPEAAFVTEPLAFVVSGLALAWDLLDHPLSRRGLGLGTRLQWMRDNAAAVVGFAIAAQVLLLIPGLDLFFLPIGVAGATRLLSTSPQQAPRRRP